MSQDIFVEDTYKIEIYTCNNRHDPIFRLLVTSFISIRKYQNIFFLHIYSKYKTVEKSYYLVYLMVCLYYFIILFTYINKPITQTLFLLIY
jgi:hypothetical protein